MELPKLPIFNHPIVEKIFFSELLSQEDLSIILKLDKKTLTEDLEKLIRFWLKHIDYFYDECEEYSANVLLYALFILKEIDAPNQLELILEVARIDNEYKYVWFGDCYTEYYWSLIVHFGYNQTEVLKENIKEIIIDSFYNEQVAMAMLQIFYRDETKHAQIREHWTELLEYYNQLPPEKIDPTYLAFFVSYVNRPNDTQMVLIKNLYKKNYIDLSVNGTFEELFDFEEPLRKMITIFDIQKDFEKHQSTQKYYEDYVIDDEDNLDFFDYLSARAGHSFPKTNRNDPCPCGSGKKYKKCCLN